MVQPEVLAEQPDAEQRSEEREEVHENSGARRAERGDSEVPEMVREQRRENGDVGEAEDRSGIEHDARPAGVLGGVYQPDRALGYQREASKEPERGEPLRAAAHRERA